jgi:hypothetical protein
MTDITNQPLPHILENHISVCQNLCPDQVEECNNIQLYVTNQTIHWTVPKDCKLHNAAQRLAGGGWFAPSSIKIRRTSQNARDGRDCFPASSTIKLQLGGKRRMDQLQIGDYVQTPRGYSRVFAFIHHLPKKTAEYIEFNEQLRLSGNHFLAANDRGTFKLARDVNEGDTIFVDGRADKVESKKVVEDEGLYAPATFDGRMIVDGTLVSCYAAHGGGNNYIVPFLGKVVDGNTVVSMVHSPLRLLNRLYFGCFSDPSTYCKSEKYGYHDYSVLMLNFKDNILSCNENGDFNLLHPVNFLALIFFWFISIIDTVVAFSMGDM